MTINLEIMKKTFLTFAFSLLIFTLNSCSENDESITRISAFKNLSVDKIGKDSDIGQKVKLDLEQFEEKNMSFNFNNIQRTSFDFIEDLKFYLVEFENNQNKFLGYYDKNNSKIYTIVEKFNIDAKTNKYIVTNLNNKVLYEFSINSNNGLKDITKHNPIDTNSLSKAPYPADFDCGTLTFSKCMQCGFDVCSQDWRCQAAATISGPAFVAGLAITCGLRNALN